MKRSPAFVLALALCLTAPLLAADGVLIVQKTTIGTIVRTHQIQIEKDRMRSEIAGVNGEKQLIIFDGPKQTLTMVYPDRKMYSEMTKAEADQMGAQAAQAMAKMKETMDKMPPAQREHMEALMKGRSGMPGAPVKMEYRKAGTDKVGKWTCDKYEGFQGTLKKQDLCTVDPKALGLTMADMEVTKQMAAFFKNMMPQAGDNAVAVGTVETVGFSGLPVRTIGYGSKGEVIFGTEMLEITRKSFAASDYAVPAGFQKQATFAGRGARP